MGNNTSQITLNGYFLFYFYILYNSRSLLHAYVICIVLHVVHSLTVGWLFLGCNMAGQSKTAKWSFGYVVCVYVSMHMYVYVCVYIHCIRWLCDVCYSNSCHPHWCDQQVLYGSVVATREVPRWCLQGVCIWRSSSCLRALGEMHTRSPKRSGELT